MQAGGIGVAPAVVLAAGVGADGEGAGQGGPGGGGDLGGDPGERRLPGGAWVHATHLLRSAGLASPFSMFLWGASAREASWTGKNRGAAGYVGRWRPSSVSPQAAAFARGVVTAVAPTGRERAKNLLRAAGKLATTRRGPGPGTGIVLHPSVAERFTRCAPGLSGPARRTLRTNLRFIGRRVGPHLYPADLLLPRERSKQPLRARLGRRVVLPDHLSLYAAVKVRRFGWADRGPPGARPGCPACLS
jgi:hypothetical protein